MARAFITAFKRSFITLLTIILRIVFFFSDCNNSSSNNVGGATAAVVGAAAAVAPAIEVSVPVQVEREISQERERNNRSHHYLQEFLSISMPVSSRNVWIKQSVILHDDRHCDEGITERN